MAIAFENWNLASTIVVDNEEIKISFVFTAAGTLNDTANTTS